MLAVSEEEGKGTHNDILVELSKKILDSNFRNRIENSSSIEEIVKLINE
jgi:PTS system fructose-specific IIA component